METERHGNGWGAFLEHSGFAITCVVSVVCSQCLFWIGRLRGAHWIQAYFVGLTVGVVAVAFLCYAKWPVYRSGRLLALGDRGLGPERRRLYWMGLVLALLDILFLAFLWFANP